MHTKAKARMSKDTKPDFILVYSIYSQGELPLIKSILQAADIECYTINEDGHVLYAPMGIDIMVAADKIDEAKELLKDFINPSK